jgi:hypothetical protein
MLYLKGTSFGRTSNTGRKNLSRERLEIAANRRQAPAPQPDTQYQSGNKH